MLPACADSYIYDFPLVLKTRRVSARHLTTRHGVCYSGSCPHYSVGKGVPLSLTQSVVVLEKQSPVIPGIISAAENWRADWQLSAWSSSWASRCVPLWGRGRKAHGACVWVHLFILNFCSGESGSLLSKSSQPGTEMLFQSLFLVCTE